MYQKYREINENNKAQRAQKEMSGKGDTGAERKKGRDTKHISANHRSKTTFHTSRPTSAPEVTRTFEQTGRSIPRVLQNSIILIRPFLTL
jgi:hypothetical protein